MAERIRTLEWSETALGHKREWPLTLVFAVDLMLSSGCPSSVQWGHEATMLYNDALMDGLGSLHPDALGRPFLEGAPDNRARLAPMLDRVMAGNTVRLAGYDVRFDGVGPTPVRMRDGEAVPIRDLTGLVGGSLIRWTWEEAERPSAVDGTTLDHTREALDSGRVSTWWFDLATMRIGGDAAFFARFGLPYSEGTVPLETVSDRLDPESRARLTSALHADPPPDGTLAHDLTLRDGAGRAISLRGGAHGTEPTVYAGVMFDLATDRGTEARRLTEARSRAAQKAAGIGTFDWIIPTNRKIWSAGLLEIYGLQEGAFGGTYKSWIEPIHSEDLAGAVACIEDALETGYLEGEWRVVRPDGTVVHLMTRGIVESDADGSPLRMTGAQVDITGRIRNERTVAALIVDLDARIERLHARLRSGNGDS